MSWLYRQLLRPFLFTQNPEAIHNLTMRSLGWVSRRALLCDLVESALGAPELPVELFGLKFPNPVGLAAGMDKHCEAVPIWPAMGFGFTELGAVTRLGQPGNPSPRVFRAVAEEAIVNRMGFNNPGADAAAETAARWHSAGRWPKSPVGMNLGKSKATPLEQAPEDYAYSFRVLRPYLDFFVVNVSSPNTPNLRKLQDKAALDEILAALQEVQKASADVPAKAPTNPGDNSTTNHKEAPPQPGGRKPILVKVAPDLSFDALDEILQLVAPRQIDGIVATNTTISRPDSKDSRARVVYQETGGLSGRPLRARSTEVIRHLHRQAGRAVPIIGVGGIFNADDAWEKICAGASLIQIYTSLVYEGPGTPQAIVQGLRQKLQQAGLSTLVDAVGTGLS